jgi:hypothetical protein
LNGESLTCQTTQIFHDVRLFNLLSSVGTIYRSTLASFRKKKTSVERDKSPNILHEKYAQFMFFVRLTYCIYLWSRELEGQIWIRQSICLYANMMGQESANLHTLKKIRNMYIPLPNIFKIFYLKIRCPINLQVYFHVVCFPLGNSPASEFYMPTFRNTLFHFHRRIGMKNDWVWEYWSFYTEKGLARK